MSIAEGGALVRARREAVICPAIALLALAACTPSGRATSAGVTRTTQITQGSLAHTNSSEAIVVGANSSEAPVARSTALRLAPEIQCAPPAQRGARAVARSEGNPAARRAAQRGLTFVAQDATAWQERHNCYGCHVQAVTLEAMSVGRGHQYDVSEAQLSTVLRGMLSIPGGHRQPQGLGVGVGGSMPATSNSFGGAAFARFDALVDGRVRDDLLAVASKLITFQGEDGSVRADHSGGSPVIAGEMQATTQAVQTWRVAYDRSANARWLDPMRRAEAWLQRRARQIADNPSAAITEINYGVFGLIAAGAMPNEPVLQSLGARLRARQSAEGAWGFSVSQPAASPFATGQTLYALRLLGAGDSDRAIARGTSFLMERQQQDGSWSHGGAGRAEAMWAVFGLVSVDVLSLDVRGVRDGQHAQGVLNIQGSAVDNGGEGVAKVELVVDDVPVARSCGASVGFSLDTAQVTSGVHSVDVVATNVRGQQSRRRLEFYSGTHYLAQLATRYTGGTTHLSWRSVAPTTVQGSVRVRVYSTRTEAGSATRDREVWSSTVANVEGPMSAQWAGRDRSNAAVPDGRYVAEVAFVRADGSVAHRQELLFAHENPEEQARRYAEVQGALALPTSGSAANTEVELVDNAGNVVQRTVTTAQGNYRFSNVDTGNYRVRVRRAGFRHAEAAVRAVAPSASPAAAPARADMQLAY